MADMKSISQKRAVVIEDYVVQFDKRDLAEMIETEDPTTTVDQRDLTICVSTNGPDGLPRSFGAAQLMEMARAKNSEIPADAEIVISVRWAKETAAPMMAPQQPIYAQQAQQPQQYQPAGQVFTPGQAVAPQDAAQCVTCGGVPGLQGPTPDCNDANGCARVRATRGELPVPKAMDPANAPQVGPGIGAGRGAKILINRENGQRAFADNRGQPYGVGHEYGDR